MKNMNQIMMQQVQKMQQKMSEMQEKLNQMDMQGVSGGGAVEVTINGKGEMRGVKIDPSLVNPEEVDILEDLIVAAFNDAKAKVDEKMAQEMSMLTGGLGLPTNFPF